MESAAVAGWDAGPSEIHLVCTMAMPPSPPFLGVKWMIRLKLKVTKSAQIGRKILIVKDLDLKSCGPMSYGR